MTYKISGEYITTCSCQLLCPCNVDGPPTGKDGHCRGLFALHITEGQQDGTDLSGIDLAMVYHIPGNVTGGNWRMGLVFNPDTPDDKVAAVEKILQGKDGGPFGDFAPLIAEYLPSERAKVTYETGNPTKAVVGKSTVTFEALAGADGNPTTLNNAMFGFAPVMEMGKGSGKVEAGGIAFDSIYGERAKFEYTS